MIGWVLTVSGAIMIRLVQSATIIEQITTTKDGFYSKSHGGGLHANGEAV